jgi:hypothetical protein
LGVWLCIFSQSRVCGLRTFQEPRVYLSFDRKIACIEKQFHKNWYKPQTIADIAELNNIQPDEKVRMMRQVAWTINEGIHTYMNTIDDNVDWGNKNVKQIYDGMR